MLISPRWKPIVTLWLLGVLAAAQLAKISVLAPMLMSRFGLSLAGTGLLISLLEVGGGIFGFAAGLALSRVGCRRALLAGVTLLAATGFLEAIAPTPATLFAARGLEGIGYLFVVISAPTAITVLADVDIRPRALALWSTFVPVGVALGSTITSLAVGALGWRGAMLIWAALLVAAIVPALRLPITRGVANRIALPPAPAWLATIAFGLYTVSICALTMLLPTFLFDQHGAPVTQSGLISAIASGATLPAFAIALWLMRSGTPNSRRMVLIATPTLIAAAALGALTFSTAVHLAGASVLAVLAVATGGIVTPLMFARLPELAAVRRPDDPRIASANGLLTQFGAGGALVGPPLGGWLVERSGWQALGTVFALLTVAMLVTIFAAERLSARISAQRELNT